MLLPLKEQWKNQLQQIYCTRILVLTAMATIHLIRCEFLQEVWCTPVGDAETAYCINEIEQKNVAWSEQNGTHTKFPVLAASIALDSKFSICRRGKPRIKSLAHRFGRHGSLTKLKVQLPEVFMQCSHQGLVSLWSMEDQEVTVIAFQSQSCSIYAR